MRKILMTGTLIAIFGAGALAQAQDVTTAKPGSAAETVRPVVRGEDESRAGHHEARRGHRERHEEAHERHDERREGGRRH